MNSVTGADDDSVTLMRGPRAAISVTVAALAAIMLVAPVSADHGAPHVTLQSGTNGCTGVLPSNDGNTDMRLVGGSLEPGGTAIFEISYPLNAGSVGKEFTILDCAFINDVPTLKYMVSFVPSNQLFVLSITLAVPVDAPVGGSYCNYVKTTGSPTASQGSQRKAGPACFIIRPPSGPGAPTSGAAPPSVTGSGPPSSTGTTPPGQRILLPDTAMPARLQVSYGGVPLNPPRLELGLRVR